MNEMKWQPIEAAPKDGTYILAYEPELGASYISIAYFAHDLWWTDSGTYNMQPTHWMPLPQPPEDA